MQPVSDLIYCASLQVWYFTTGRPTTATVWPLLMPRGCVWRTQRLWQRQASCRPRLQTDTKIVTLAGCPTRRSGKVFKCDYFNKAAQKLFYLPAVVIKRFIIMSEGSFEDWLMVNCIFIILSWGQAVCLCFTSPTSIVMSGFTLPFHQQWGGPNVVFLTAFSQQSRHAVFFHCFFVSLHPTLLLFSLGSTIIGSDSVDFYCTSTRGELSN